MEQVLQYFREICAIPHGSGNMEAIGQYLLDFAAARGLFAARDEAGNVVIKKDAAPGYEKAETVILQGHCDMVCEKDADYDHDFLRDPLELFTEGDWLGAKGTTLGGDDGVAVAYMLAILSRDDIPHPKLECVFTVDEEIGLLGAAALDYSLLEGRRMLNLDSEEEGVLLAGCAGGMSLEVCIPAVREDRELSFYQIHISGLLGGHSGNEIHKGRANAAHLAGRLLFDLSRERDICLECLAGGTKDNAIPRESEITIGLEEEAGAELAALIGELEATYRREYSGIETSLQISCEFAGREKRAVLDPKSFERALFYLRQLPDGVEKMSGEIPGLVETSCNLGILELRRDSLFAVTSVRSSLESAKRSLAERICYLAEFLGGEVSAEGIYPAWEYAENCPWRELAKRVYAETRGEEPRVEVIHAGLECGLFSENLPGLSCISIGPDMRDIHTSRERLSLSSTERVYGYVLNLLKEAKE